MKIVVDDLREGKVVRVDVGHRLDLTAYKTLSEVTVCAVEDSQVVAIVVDFSGTHQLFDSGKAILFDLIMRTRYLNIPLRLVNAGTDISLKLLMLEFSTDGLHRNSDVAVAENRWEYVS
jgi:anti-anti-sigma regulatory factor